MFASFKVARTQFRTVTCASDITKETIMEVFDMARGDFGKAFREYRRSGGKLSRKDFAATLWRAKPA